MKKIIQKILPVFVTFLMGLNLLPAAFYTAPAYAATPTTTFGAEAAILQDCAKVENGHGESIKCIVLLVVDILTILVGVVGVIGIVVVGIQYLTAGGNEEQTRKAKRRLFEIVIGIIAFVLINALLKWLLPDFSPETNNTSSVTSIIASLDSIGV